MQSALAHLRAFSQDLSDLAALESGEPTKKSHGLMLAPAMFCAGIAAAALAAAFFIL
ncbi:MAG: hypothetical protein ACO1PB_14490 [Ramlibacter sp.]